MLSFDWSSDNILGNTLSDGAVLFSLTFGIRGNPGDTTSVAFTDGWTPLHFESAENIDLPFASVPGTITIVPEPETAALVGLGAGVLAMRRRWGASRARRILRAFRF